MLKQWIEVEGHMVLNGKMLNVKTHRDFFFSFTNGACVYFTVVMEIFSHLLGHQSYSNAHYHNRGDGILYSAKSTGME